MRIRIVALVAVAGLAVVGVAAAKMATAKVKGSVGPGFDISLKSSTGKKVRTLKTGRYTFVVTDKSSEHNFTLSGPGIRGKTITGTGFTGTKSATVTLRKGAYQYFCTVHPEIQGKFKVS